MEDVKMLVLLVFAALMVAVSAYYDERTIRKRRTDRTSRDIEKVLIVWWSTLTYCYAMVICSIIFAEWAMTIACLALFLVCVMTCEQLWRMLKKYWRNKR